MHLEESPDIPRRTSQELSAVSCTGLQARSDTHPAGAAGRLLFKEAPNPAQDSGIHGWSDAPRLGILLAGVVNAK